MGILIDSSGLQARQHLDSESEGRPVGRLTSFLSSVRRFGAVGFTQSAVIGESELTDAEMLIIATRKPECPFEVDEIARLHRFVIAGGSLLLMSNHSRSATGGMGHYTEEDGRLAQAFGVRILEAAFRNPSNGELMSIEKAAIPDHPILFDARGERAVRSVVINNCSAVSRHSAVGQPLLLLNEGMEDIGPHGLSPVGEAFAWSIDDYRGGGRVVVMGDSGFIGESKLPSRGPGLFDRAQNQLFVERTVDWLING